MDNKYRTQFNEMKKERREKKRCEKRSITGEEVIFIFEKFIEGWTTIRIYNTIIQNDKNSSVDKKKVETIVSGNCKVYENELSSEKYKYYLELRTKIYELHNINKQTETTII
jgi:hypothetical protein